MARGRVVPQEEVLRVAKEVGVEFMAEDMAEHLQIHEVTAKNKLDGLVHQGKLQQDGKVYWYEEKD